MKNRFKVIFTSLLAGLALSLSSCNSLHIHEYEYKYDEDHHWQECVHCGDRIGVTTHKMNSVNDTCIVCGYKDKVVLKDEDGVMTGLTKYAMTKEKVTVPSDITYIGKEAFKDSSVDTVVIEKSLVGIYSGAFNGSKNLSGKSPEYIKSRISTQEGTTVDWYKIGDVYYKYNEAEGKEAMVNGNFYTTFEEAVAAVREDNTTITLLKDIQHPGIGKSIDINFNINLEAMPGLTVSLPDMNFVIKPSAYLRIASSVKFEKGYVKLLLDEIKERVGTANKETLGYSSGSLIFLEKTEEPDTNNLTVEYVKSIDDEEGMPANGSKHSELLADCFAYGTVKMDKSMTNIIGLTDYGASLNTLTVANPIKNKTFDIHEWAFTTPTQIRIKIPLKDIKINLNQQKGYYRHLTVGNGIKRIGFRAFSNWYDGDQIPQELVTSLAPLLAPLTTLNIDNSVEEICEGAFYYCAGLTQVSTVGDGESNLKTIGVAAFQQCFNLNKVDFGKCVHLDTIQRHAFLGDTSLKSLTLACDTGWSFGGDGYIPEDMRDPGNAAFLAVHVYFTRTWNRNLNAKFCYYNPNDKDEKGRFNHVHYTNDFQSAYNAASDNYVISACSKDATIDDNITINKTLRLNISTNYEGTAKLGKVNINPGKYFIVTDKLVDANTGFYLKTDGKDFEYKNVSGVAIERSVNSTPSNDYNIWLANSNNQCTVKNEVRIAKLNDGKSYDAFGLVNFKLNPNEHIEKFNSLSVLGKIATEFELAPQIYDGYIELADNLFSGNNNIRKVTFSRIKKIPRHALADNISKTIEEAVFKNVWEFDYRAFAGCKKLYKVDFTDNSFLKTIGEKAFCECPNLKEIVLPQDCDLTKIGKNAFDQTPLTSFNFANNKTNWRANNHSFTDTELSTENAAKLLTTAYKSYEWIRSK